MGELVEAYKAVSLRDGALYSLGMGPAVSIPLPQNAWLEGGEYGIGASRTPSGARSVIGFAKGRKKLPIPPAMRVVKVLGQDVKFANDWRYVFGRIMILEEAWVDEQCNTVV